MRVYWCDHCGNGRNFGDQLTPQLLRLAGISFVWAPGEEAQVVMVGSVLSAVPKHRWRGVVAGTGFIEPQMRRDLRWANVLAVRGALTRRATRLPLSTPLGDMGVLAPLLDDGRSVAPVAELAIGHYVDDTIGARHPRALVMRTTSDVRDLIAAIKGAGIVYTSSLHALILADALGVAHVWEKHVGVRGSGFKFADYASALDETIRPNIERLSDRRSMTELTTRAMSWLDILRSMP